MIQVHVETEKNEEKDENREQNRPEPISTEKTKRDESQHPIPPMEPNTPMTAGTGTLSKKEPLKLLENSEKNEGGPKDIKTQKSAKKNTKEGCCCLIF